MKISDIHGYTFPIAILLVIVIWQSITLNYWNRLLAVVGHLNIGDSITFVNDGSSRFTDEMFLKAIDEEYAKLKSKPEPSDNKVIIINKKNE